MPSPVYIDVFTGQEVRISFERAAKILLMVIFNKLKEHKQQSFQFCGFYVGATSQWKVKLNVS